MTLRYFCLLLLVPLSIETEAQVKTDKWLLGLLSGKNDSLVNSVLKQPDVYRYQIIYTRIDRDQHNNPSFKNYYLNVDPYRYFNPASMVKMPLAFLSLEKLNRISNPGVNKYTTMLTDSGWSKQTIAWTDSSAETGLPSIAQYIRKAFLVSDNDAYNRMYEFLGQQTINRRLHEMGYPGARITRRFMRMTAEENRYTNPVRFVDNKGSVLFSQPTAYNTDSFDFSRRYRMGRAYINAQDSLVNEPFDFTTANNLSLEDMQQLLQSVMFPTSVAARKRFGLSRDDYDFLYRYMSQYPSETNYPKYDTAQYYDSYVKFFFRSPAKAMPTQVRVFNKVGWAYGCLTDVSYVADFKNRVEFMLAVTIYVNSDGVLNDNKYDYETIGWPFLYRVGQIVYEYERKRQRQVKPNLSRFKLEYRVRPEDGRPPIRDADN